MNLLKSFHWTEKMEVVCLAAMLLLIPIDSGASLVSACVWMLVVALKNTILKRWSFFGWHQDKNYHYSKNYYFLIPMICYWFRICSACCGRKTNRRDGWKLDSWPVSFSCL